MDRRFALLLAAVLFLCVTLVAQPGVAQSDRFDGWDQIRDGNWRFDPDNRPSLGFSVRASSAARLALDEALAALDSGRPTRAALLMHEAVLAYRDHVLQVGGGNGRWVGAGELALYLLETAITADVRHAAGEAVMEREVELDRAIAWRDEDVLRRLATELEGLPVGARATEMLARLLAEAGRDAAAAAAVERAVALGAGPDIARLGEAMASRAAELDLDAVPSEVSLVSLGSDWQHVPTTAWLPGETGSGREPDVNVFAQSPDIDEAPFAPLYPVVHEGVVYVADTVSVSALDVHSGRQIWHYAGPLEVVSTRHGSSDGWFTYDIYAQRQRSRAISPMQVARPVIAGRTLVASVQALEAEHDLQTFDSVPINWPLPRRRLVALDRSSGEVLWIQERPDEGRDAFVNRFDVHGPVAVQGDTLYAGGSITEGSIDAYLAAFDLRTGDLVWRTFLCSGQQELTMFNRPFQEHVTSPPRLHDGALYMATNLGVVACVDAWSGRTRWIAGYPQTVRRASRSHAQNQRRDVYWLNRAPEVSHGVLVIAPLDSQVLMGLDPQTGMLAWSPISAHKGHRRRLRHQYQVTPEGELLVVGEDSLERLDVRTGRDMDPELFEREDLSHDVSAPVVLLGRHLLVPTRRELLAVDLDDWRVTGSASWPRLDYRRVRRVVPAGLVTIWTDHEQICGSLDTRLVIERLESSASSSLSSAATLAEVLLGDGRFEEARVRFEDLARRDQDGLFADQARTGLLEASLGLSRRVDDVAGWLDLMNVADGQDALLEYAAEALLALEELGASAEVDGWLDRFLEEVDQGAGGRRVDERRLFEIVVALADRRHDGRKAELARRVGETTYAEALEGRLPEPAERQLPALPTSSAELVSLEVSPKYRLGLPRTRGTRAPEWRRDLLGAMNGQGQLVMLDSARGRQRWSAPMPAELQAITPANADFVYHDDQLVVLARNTLTVLALETGRPVWSAVLDGDPVDVAVHGGLVLVLVREDGGDDRHTVLAFGLRTGTFADAIPLPLASSAYLFSSGRSVLVFLRVAVPGSATPVMRMVTLDPIHGRIAHETTLPPELQFVIRPVESSQSVLFKGLGEDGPRLTLWSAQQRAVTWWSDVPLGARMLLPPTAGRLALVQPTTDPLTGGRSDEVLSVDVETGASSRAAVAGPRMVLTSGDEGPVPQIVLLDTRTNDRVGVIDTHTGHWRCEVPLDRPLQGTTRLVHGRDGFVLGSVHRPADRGARTISVLVVRGEEGKDRYSIDVETLIPYYPLEMALVENGVVLAQGGRVWMLRDLDGAGR